MSLIPGLGNLGPIGKLLDPGAIVKDVVNGVLPKNMGVVGDLAGAFVDFKMGNPIGAVQHAMEAVKDLPQAAKGLQGSASNGTNLNRLPPGMEPSPPPLASRDGKAFDWNELLSAIKSLTAALSGRAAPAPGSASGTMDAAATPDAGPTNGATTKSDLPPANAAANGASASATPAKTDTPATATTATAFQPEPWRGQPVARPDGGSGRRSTAAAEPEPWRGEALAGPASANASAGSAVAAAAQTPTTKAEASAPPPAPDAPAASATTLTAPSSSRATGQTITSMSQLDGMSDSAIREAVIRGRISPEVAKDSTAMMAIQQRLNSIAEMNNLMTGMMRAIHDMQMAVIQNIRI